MTIDSVDPDDLYEAFIGVASGTLQLSQAQPMLMRKGAEFMAAVFVSDAHFLMPF